jgi:hypothetical protein
MMILNRTLVCILLTDGFLGLLCRLFLKFISILCGLEEHLAGARS